LLRRASHRNPPRTAVRSSQSLRDLIAIESRSSEVGRMISGLTLAAAARPSVPLAAS
jgi:hypothetical protein